MTVSTTQEPVYAGTQTTYGYLKTDGNSLVDRETGETVRLVGVNWHGAEGTTKVPGGLWERNYKEMMGEMVEAGFNSLRIPISPAILDNQPVYNGIRRDANPDLYGLTPLEILDKIIDYAEQTGLRVVLDMHRITPGVGKQESGLWYNNSYSEADLVQDWKQIAKHYADNPTVIGFDVFNEPSGPAHWAEDGSYNNDWHRVATKLGNQIHKVNPDALIFVQGNHIVDGDWYWVGGNLSGAEDDPIELNKDNRLVYSPHDYPYSVQNVPWLEGATKAEIKEGFEEHWGYLFEGNEAPVVIGETGARLQAAADTRYLNALFEYLEETENSSSDGIGFFWWTWGPNSGDTGGILDTWYKVDQDKLDFVQRVDAELLPTTQAAANYIAGKEFNITFEQTNNPGIERTYSYVTRNGTAQAGQDYAAETGIIRLAPGETSTEFGIRILGDQRTETTENFFVDVYYQDGQKFRTIEVKIKDRVASVSNQDDTDESGNVQNSTGEEADATRNYGFGTHVLRVEIDETSDGEFDVYGSLERWDGKAINRDWRLRLDEEVEGPVSFDFGDELEIKLRNDGNLRLTAAEDMPAGETDFEFNFSVSAGGENAAINWSGQSSGLGTGRAELSGSSTQSSNSPLDVDFTSVQTWQSGEFVAKVAVTNTSNAIIKDWQIELLAEGFTLDAEDVHTAVAWEQRSTGNLQVRPHDWNDDLSPGETYVFGISAKMDATEPSLSLTAAQIAEQLEFYFI
ncbi:MAG: cellulase family glycosylhydrolase [Pseudomonadota bacterium]